VPAPPTLPQPLGPSDVVPVTRLAAGDAYAIVRGGSISPVDIQITDGRHVLSSDGMSISVSGDQPSQVGSTLVLYVGGTTEINGTDFLAGSTVQVWLFSEPTLIGEVVAEANGSFRIQALIPMTMASGSHTIVVSGVRADGNAEAVALGVAVAQAPAAAPTTMLPTTGASPKGLLLAAFVLVALGTVLATRRRPVA
jgi:LPXTG-motif cell wall-anchored protein